MGIRKLRNRLLGRDIPFYFDILDEYLRKNDYVSFSLPVKIGGSGGNYSSGYLRPSDGARECEREIFYLLSGAPAEEEIFDVKTFKRFVVGTTHHSLWTTLLKQAGEWSKKFKVVEGERLIDNELFVAGTPDFYVVTEDNSILNEWKTLDPSRYLQRAALESGNVVEIERMFDMMRNPYKGNKIQCHWYGMMSLDNKYHAKTSNEFKEAVDKYKGDGYIVYEEKTQSMLIPHKVSYNYEDLSPYVEKIHMVNKCFETGTIPGIRCRGKGERFNQCPYKVICRSEDGEKSRLRNNNDRR